jgi:hypothetical protein
MSATMTLYRPVGPKELEVIQQSGFKRFPPRLPEQPIFYPVVQEEYARKIARDWNVKASGAGYVTRFAVRADHLRNYEQREAGGPRHTEYWIPAEALETFNDNIVGRIEVIAEFLSAEWVVAYDLAADHETIALVQRATSTTKEFGLVPEIAMFGSDEWWAAIGDGRIPKQEVAGTVSRLYMSGHGDWPMFELDSDGARSSWTRLGNGAAYAEGKEVRIEYVMQRPRRPGLGEQKQVLRILVKDVTAARG